MKGDSIPLTDHLALHCQPSVFLERDEAGNPTGVNSDAFRVDADGISTNWLEYFSSETCFAETCKIFQTLRTVRQTHRVGIMKVIEIVDAGASAGKNNVKAVEDPINPKNPAHALIVGIKPEDDSLLQALTALVEFRSFPTG